ncbi:hypothetical protein [Lactococcus garvieae]|uniref:hypothetical protein n=1 Tax=Lactococcus garvieae TaxID=1363 RepID=UPI0025508CEE|nr:hypothetical protein [Lactococcus garvieae]
MDKIIQNKIKEIQELLVKNIVTSYQIEKDTYGAIKQSSLNSFICQIKRDNCSSFT